MEPSIPFKSMTLEEARAVKWLRKNYKPLGELLDTGFLNKRRLEWAAAKAYDPALKQAAAVLLDWLQRSNPPATVKQATEPASYRISLPPLEVDMTLEQARATLWPLPPFKGQPMGDLLDSQQLSLKDLGYAVEKAWEKRVKHAATILLATRLNQTIKEPWSAGGALQIVSAGRSFAERRQYALTFVQGMAGGAIVAFICSLFVWAVVRQAATPVPPVVGKVVMSPVGVVVLIVAVALAAGSWWLSGWAFDKLMSRFETQKQYYRKGEEGEDRAVEIIRQTLNGDWFLFRNIELPGRKKTDLDGVLLGPPGIWVLEVKSFSGEYRNIGEQWEMRIGNRWALAKSNPSRQAQDNAVRLSNFLSADNIRQWVNPAVIWAGDALVSVENPAVPVWPLDRLSDELGNAWQKETLAEPLRVRIAEKLTKLCQGHGTPLQGPLI